MTGEGADPGQPGGTGTYARFRTDVRPDWVDYNGHLTDWAYAVVCSMANEELLDALDLGAAYRERTGCAMFTVEAQLRYLAEVGPDAQVLASSTYEADAKRLRVRTVLRDQRDIDVLAAEHVYLHVDTTTGRVTPFSSPPREPAPGW
jgi:acyl-CoA thioester hydrolase